MGNLIKWNSRYFLLFLAFVSIMGSGQLYAQGTVVEGTVKDASGLTLPGVNILEKGTTNGVSTDFDGNFKIKVSNPKAVLTFSFIGFKNHTENVNGRKSIQILMEEEANQLNEVVVIGYGTAKKSDLTGSVATISGGDLKKQSISNVAETLTGRLAGVQVSSAEGSPDAEVKIRIRGGGSLTQDSSPLIIVDGFPVNSLSDISPSDIENITVLKDASSTAIYGSRGANGVMIITTKSGKGGKLAVTYNAFYGVKKIAKTIDVLSPEDYAKWQYEYAVLNKDLNSYEKYFGQYGDIDQYKGMKGNDWQRQIYGRLGEVQSHDLGIRGGSESTSYNFNYANFQEKAIMVGSEFQRNNLSFSLKNKTSDKLDLTFTMRYSDTEIRGGGANEQGGASTSDGRLRHSVGYSPIPLPGLTTDDTDEAVAGYLVNPFVAVADNDRTQKRKNFNFLGGLNYKIYDNLQFKSDLGLDNYNYWDARFYGRSTFYVNNVPAAENQSKPAVIISDRKDVRFRNANTLNYDFKNVLNENHRLKILVGEEMIGYKSNQITSTIHGFPKFFDFQNAVNLSSQGIPQSVNNFYMPNDNLLSFFGRVNYDINNRYLLTATYRADGSSKFLGDNRWGFFPSAAVAWKMNEEDFLKDAKWINSLKVRLSYGQAGNNNIPVGQTVQNFQSSNTEWINGVPNYWSASKVMANPDLKWETTITQNFGVDYDFFKGRLTGSVEVYKNLTKDLLMRFPVPGSGYDFQYRNMGETQNKGLEASLNIAAIEREDYGLSFSLNVGFNRNNINSLGIMDNFGDATGWASTAIGNDFLVNVGQPIGIMYGYKNDGRYEVSDFDYSNGTYTLKPGVANSANVVGTVMPGTMKLKDLDGDGLVTAKDLTVIGDSNPKSTGGFIINANAYGFDLSAAFNWSIGNDVYNANKIEFTTANQNGQYRNLSTIMQDGNRWTNINASGQLVTDPTELAALNAKTTMWSPNMSKYVFSDWAVEDGSFLRLNMITLGYTLPQKLIEKLHISKLRVYTTCNNVFVISNYSGLDPEVSTRRSTPLTPGVDYSPYPRSRQAVFGVNLTF
ncbi:SusC/RagA family TonB-linked outer membrane protein [Flavobacterium sp. RSSA_27]|uniref:SusC/RagA family TonB-linked outer membrane protein n=1 Tax=Flavobacterium sp. RSSA_27 TaxID=3447667 RepID=UPI003F358107